MEPKRQANKAMRRLRTILEEERGRGAPCRPLPRAEDAAERLAGW